MITVPAIRLHQFGVFLYEAILGARDVDRLVRREVADVDREPGDVGCVADERAGLGILPDGDLDLGGAGGDHVLHQVAGLLLDHGHQGGTLRG